VTEVPGFGSKESVKDRPDGRTVFAVSADGKRAVTEGSADAYLVFEVATGKTVRTLKAPGGVGTIAGHELCPASLSGDGRVLAFDSGKGPTRAVIVWDLEQDAELAKVSVPQNQNVTPLLSPDGKVLATRGLYQPGPNSGAGIQLWDVATGKSIATLTATAGYGSVVTFSADGRTVATSSRSSGTVRLWDATTGKPGLTLLGRSALAVAVAFSPDGKTLAALGQNGAIDRWALPGGKPLKPTSLVPSDLAMFDNNPYVEGLMFADNERAVAWGWAQAQRVAMVWEAPDVKSLTSAAGHFGAIAALRFSPDGKEVITAGMDKRVIRWEVATGRQTLVGKSSPRGRWQYSHLAPDATTGLASGAVHDLATGEELFALPGGYAFASADFRRAAGFHWMQTFGADSTWCEVWDLENQRRLVRLTPPNTRVMGGAMVAFSPDNARMVTAVELGVQKPDDPVSVIVTGWDLTTGKKLGELRETKAARLRFEDGRTHIATGTDSGAVLAGVDGKLWVADYERGTRGQTLAELDRVQQRFVYPTFSPDGKMFAVGRPIGAGLEHGVAVFDWPGGKLLHTFAGHTGPITGLAFAPDGKALASGSTDGTVLVWDLVAIGKPK
jgi:WD40 repeat protein